MTTTYVGQSEISAAKQRARDIDSLVKAFNVFTERVSKLNSEDYSKVSFGMAHIASGLYHAQEESVKALAAVQKEYVYEI